MLFNSLSFAIFLPIVFVLYWILGKSRKSQNLLLLFASFYFYGCWDWRFLFLLAFSIFLDYFTGIQIEKSVSDLRRKMWLWISIGVNLGFLCFFKYYNFFAESFADLLATFGLYTDPWILKIILPVGISFYTFHGLSYVIDIYKKRISAERNLVDYSLFVSFFPLLVAGPIERATHLLPQIKSNRLFQYDQAVNGLRQILWGLFKKMVIADNCAHFVNIIFDGSDDYSGSTLLLGGALFAFQIYGDFSGYSDIAIGTAKLFGINLLKNFNYPYFSRDIAEFWRRWHISLSSWFRDYLYIPLGGSKGGNRMRIRNTFIIFIVSGFWHGANWTFIFWGFLNALFILPSIIFKTNRNNLNIVAENSYLPSFKEFFSMAITFLLSVIAWIFFRSDNLSQAFGIVGEIFSISLFTKPDLPGVGLMPPTIILIVFFVFVEWLGRKNHFAIEKIFSRNAIPRFLFYYLLLVLLFLYKGKEQTFIYFQF